jgi:BMFP domain-containing protein YqiC
MSDASIIEDFVHRLRQKLDGILPADLPRDIEAQLKPAVDSLLSQFQLVPRAEFQRQLEQIERLEQRLAEMQSRIAALESGGTGTPGTSAGDDNR